MGRQSRKTATITSIDEIGFEGTCKSQLNVAEYPVFDRIAFA
jgi:hypothetical protein